MKNINCGNIEYLSNYVFLHIMNRMKVKECASLKRQQPNIKKQLIVESIEIEDL